MTEELLTRLVMWHIVIPFVCGIVAPILAWALGDVDIGAMIKRGSGRM